MTFTEPQPMSRAKAIAYAIGLPGVLVILVFLPVGRLDWVPGWIFLGFLVVAFAVSAIILWRVNPAIYRARSRFQAGTERWDRILLLPMLPAMVAEIPLATLDAGRLSWSDMPVGFIVLGYLLLPPASPPPPGRKRSIAFSNRVCDCRRNAASTSSPPAPMRMFAIPAISAHS